MTDADRRDEELAAILDRATAAKSGERPSLEALLAAHPQYSAELRELWGAVMVVDALAIQNERQPSTKAESLFGRTNSFEPPPRELDDFELIEEIARGGMGAVYRARQKSLDREVAVKVMLRGAAASPDDRARFQAESESAAGLEHPHIVPIYGAGEADGWRYLGMKLIRGRTLAHRLTAGPIPQREAARLVMIVARAVHYAHDRGVIHRDLKPANILLDEQGLPHVSDFGLAKLAAAEQALTNTGSILGTPLYMAPEQAAAGRGEVGPQSDVFSLGAILYALVTGQPPFEAATPVGTVLRLLEQDPDSPRRLNPTLSRDLEMVILRAIQKPPELRYRTAAALADDLTAFLDDEPVAARSGRLTHVVARVFGDSHHAAVLENWGLLWMWHAAVLVVLCGVTSWLHLQRDRWAAFNAHWPYLALWGGGLAIWGPIFWAMRRRTGPVTAVERHIAHAWAGSIVAVVGLFVVEWILGLEVLQLSPVLGLVSGMVFVVKAGILSGAFYASAAALFACAPVMAVMQRQGIPCGTLVFGLVCAAAFFIPGLKYYRESPSRPC